MKTLKENLIEIIEAGLNSRDHRIKVTNEDHILTALAVGSDPMKNNLNYIYYKDLEIMFVVINSELNITSYEYIYGLSFSEKWRAYARKILEELRHENSKG